MNKKSILHIPMSHFAYGSSEDTIVIRIRVGKDELDTCSLFYGDTACRTTPIDFYEEKMLVVASDQWFDYYEIEFKSKFHRIYYYFELKEGHSSSYYYSDFFRDELVDDRSEYYKIPINHKGNLATIPEWTYNAVIYNIFPDSFATDYAYTSGEATETEYKGLTTRGLLGGTIKGITNNVDYLVKLGVNCIYINPLFVAGEYHKYDTIDYYHIDPNFGTDDDFKELVQVFHNHGIRVLIDGVFNHCGWQFFAFEDVLKYGEDSVYKEWFYKLTYPVKRPENPELIPGYECFAYERLMPKLDTTNEAVKAYLLDVASYWIKEFDIDGWRLDVASEVDDGFWRAFRQVVKKIKPDAFIIGEVWESAGHWLDGSQFDSTMNYDLRKHSKYFFARGEIDAAEFEARVTHMRMRYFKHYVYGQLNLLDSHDVSRFLSVCDDNVDRHQLAIVFQMMFVGIPSIFYGDEQGLSGLQEPEYRKPMQWNVEHPMFQFYKKGIAIRHRFKAISHGDYKTIRANENTYVYAFDRIYGQEKVRVIMNVSKEEAEISDLIEDNQILWGKNYAQGLLQGFGFVVLDLSKIDD